jgi:hypothetical protein
MKIAISQPTYLPWLGYFDLIDQVDLFVLFDSVQFERQSWQQRNRIKTPVGLQWLTVPVMFRGRFGQTIKDVEIRDLAFWRKHLRAIELNYRRSAFFDSYFPDFSLLLQSCVTDPLLVNCNVRLIEWFNNILGIQTPLIRSSGGKYQGKRAALLTNICQSLQAARYVSPLGSAVYLLDEIDSFADKNIEVAFQHYQHPEYTQQFPPFLAYASALDLIFNEGPAALEIIRRGRGRSWRPEELSPHQVDVRTPASATATFQP